MGQYYNWIEDHYTQDLTGIELVEILKSKGFIYRIVVKDNNDIGATITDCEAINEMTTGEWTGFFAANLGSYMIFFKIESDAAAAKLKWT